MATEVLYDQCTRCKGPLTPETAKKDAKRRSGIGSWCRKCANDASKAWMAAHPEKVRAYQNSQRYRELKAQRERERRAKLDPEAAHRLNRYTLLNKYRMTPDDYDRLLARQGGTCAICDRRPEDCAKKFAVDHDHGCCTRTPYCGRCNRGLLCSRCNLFLGQLEGKDAWLARATTYLEEHRGS